MSALSAMFDDGAAKALALAKTGSAPDVAKNEEKSRAKRTLFASVVIASVGYAAALIISWLWDQPSKPTIASGLNAFTLLFIMALAIERLIQPFAPVLGPDSSVAKAEAATETDPVEKERLDAKVSDDRSKTAIVTWAAATSLGMLTAVGLNMTVLGAVLDPASQRPPYWLDLLVTGLAVGAGTKPLNDLWTRLQAK